MKFYRPLLNSSHGEPTPRARVFTHCSLTFLEGQREAPLATVLVGKLKVFIFEETIHEDDQLAHTGRHGDQWFFTCRQ